MSGSDNQKLSASGEYPRGKGWKPTPPDILHQARLNAQRLKTTRLANLFGLSPVQSLSGGGAELAGGPVAAARPRVVDWRSRNVIGPVTDQERCGSCVSFATAGLVGAMAAIEHGTAPISLSEADSHFNSSHGPNCGGWDNGTALNQMRQRGVVALTDEPYDAAFDTPRVMDPEFPGQSLWVAHTRAVADRERKAYTIMDVSAWTGDDRKTYLANVGPLVCEFQVYDNFYAGGVYRQGNGKNPEGHAVLVVGYNDDEQCWICRNSWGLNFAGPAKADGTGAGYFKIGYAECGIDNEAFFGAQGIVEPASPRWGGWWPVQGGIAAPNTSVFGVSRSADKLDIFCAGTDHGIDTAAWQPGDTTWHGWWGVKSGVAAANSSITGVSRSADKLDIFCVGGDQHIYTAAWQAGDTAWRGWWPLAGGVAAPSTSVFGVSRSADKLDVFCVGADFEGVHGGLAAG